MRIKQTEALSIAKKFTMQEYQGSDLSIIEEEIRFEKDGFGRTVLGLTENYWLITFVLKSTQVMALYSGPENFTVLVGAESGDPHWLPAL